MVKDGIIILGLFIVYIVYTLQALSNGGVDKNLDLV